jgi:RNA polymerase sigma factor (sigma-70 family)
VSAAAATAAATAAADPARQESFLAFLEAHRPLLYKVARIYGRSAADREDLVQEMAMQTWRSFPRYDARQKASTWLYRIALNVAISWLRRETARHRHILSGGEELLEVEGGLAGAATVEDEEVTLLYECIDRFDHLDRALLLLYLEGLAHQEISGVLGITATNVATRIGRLKPRLREMFRAAGRL